MLAVQRTFYRNNRGWKNFWKYFWNAK